MFFVGMQRVLANKKEKRGGMKSLMMIKARFQRPGTTKEVHCYCKRCLTYAKCKPRGKLRAPLWSFTSGNPMQHMSQKTAI